MNPETAKIIDRLVTSRDGLRKLDIADYAMIRDAREAMADAANALTNYAKTFAVIEQNDQAAAPHLYPASGEVGERLNSILSDPTYDGSTIHLSCEEAADLLSALSEATERAGRMERERDEARGVVLDTLWMARRYADGRQSYAVGMYNDAAKIAEAGGYAKGEPDGTLYALDGLRPEYQAVEQRAQAAQAEATRLKEKLDEAEAKTKRTETLIAKARTLSDTLKAYGYPVSAAHWANASGQMSVQARALHLAAESLIEGLAALRWTEEASQGEGE